MTTEHREKYVLLLVSAFIYEVMRMSFTVLDTHFQSRVCLLVVNASYPLMQPKETFFFLEIYCPGAQNYLQTAALVLVARNSDNSALALLSRPLHTL